MTSTEASTTTRDALIVTSTESSHPTTISSDNTENTKKNDEIFIYVGMSAIIILSVASALLLVRYCIKASSKMTKMPSSLSSFEQEDNRPMHAL